MEARGQLSGVTSLFAMGPGDLTQAIRFGDKRPLLSSHLAGPNVVIFQQLSGKGAFCFHPGFIVPHTYCMYFSRSLTYLFIILLGTFCEEKNFEC